MSVDYSVNAWQLIFRPSYRLTAILICAALGNSVLLLILPLPWYVSSSAVIGVLGATGYSVALHGLLALPRAVTGMQHDERGRVQFITRQGTLLEMSSLEDSTFVTPYLTVLNVRIKSKRHPRHLVILPDSLSADEFRQLRLWLLWVRHTPDTTLAREP